MAYQGETAPDFTVLKAGGDGNDDIEEFTLSDAIGDGPIVLAFYPAAFTGGCSDEMKSFQKAIDWFDDNNTQVFGISVDLPSSQNVWINQEGFGFPMLSDANHEVIRKYDVVREDVYGNLETARRSIFVVDSDGIIRYRWVQTGDLPEFDALIDEVRSIIEEVNQR